MHTWKIPCENKPRTNGSWEKGLKLIFSRPFRRNMAQPTPWFLTSSLQNCEKIYFCCLSLSVVLCYGSPTKPIHPSCSLLFPQCLVQCLAYSRHSMNSSWMNKWVSKDGVRIKWVIHVWHSEQCTAYSRCLITISYCYCHPHPQVLGSPQCSEPPKREPWTLAHPPWEEASPPGQSYHGPHVPAQGLWAQAGLLYLVGHYCLMRKQYKAVVESVGSGAWKPAMKSWPYPQWLSFPWASALTSLNFICS